jgi:hypothetical protein
VGYGIPATKCITGQQLARVPGTTCHGCYALRANYEYPSVKASQGKRFASLESPQWVDAMVALYENRPKRKRACGKANGPNGCDYCTPRVISTGKTAYVPVESGWFRWHDSGDIQSVAHLANIAEVARRLPRVRFWLPTREYGILKAYTNAGHTVPENLTIRASAHKIDGTPPTCILKRDGAQGFYAVTSTVHSMRQAQGFACSAPSNAGHCGDCRACWSQDVENVSYHKH